MSTTEARKLRTALGKIAALDGVGAEKAAVLRQLLSEIAAGSRGTWQVTEVPADDGAYIFAGRLNEVAVITTDGTVYRGRLGPWQMTTRGIKLDYSQLEKV